MLSRRFERQAFYWNLLDANLDSERRCCYQSAVGKSANPKYWLGFHYHPVVVADLRRGSVWFDAGEASLLIVDGYIVWIHRLDPAV